MWIWTCVAPHPPVVVPEVGRGRELEAEGTLRGFLDLGKELSKPEILLILSPHAPFVPGKIFLGVAEKYEGSFKDFGAPSVRLVAAGLLEVADVLKELFEKAKIPLAFFPDFSGNLDHGCTVPLYYLSRFWKTLPPLVVMNPAGLSPKDSYDAGRALIKFLPQKNWGLLASGDLSHGVTPSAPGRYHPWGERFDHMVVSCLERGESLPLRELSPEERKNAQECGLASVLCALGLVEDRPFQVLSYEAPFGVGYCTAFCKGDFLQQKEEA